MGAQSCGGDLPGETNLRVSEALRTGGLLHHSLFAPLLPTPYQTLLLRFCLHRAPRAVQAWVDWRRGGGDPEALLRIGPRGVRGLNVLLLEALRRHRISQTDTAFQILRMGVLKEKLRTDAYRRTLAETLNGLRRAGIPFLVLKGAALAETVYANPVQRHCHDIDLLVRREDFPRTDESLRALGFQRATHGSPSNQHAAFVHANELPLEIHAAPTRLAGSERLTMSFWRDARPVEIAGVPAAVPAPHHGLLQVLAIWLYSPKRNNLRWAADAWFVLANSPDLDWDALIDAAHDAQVSLALAVALDYLAENLDAPVPAHVIQRLTTASRQEAVGRDNTLYALWATTRRDLRAINWLLGGRHLRRPVIRWLFLPTREYLVSAYGAGSRGTMLWKRSRRILGYLGGRIHFQLNRLSPRRRPLNLSESPLASQHHG
jgi:hypothetical protein